MRRDNAQPAASCAIHVWNEWLQSPRAASSPALTSTLPSCSRRGKQDLLLRSLAPPALLPRCAERFPSGRKSSFCFQQLRISRARTSCKAKNNRTPDSSSPFSSMHPGKHSRVPKAEFPAHACLLLGRRKCPTHPSVVMVTIVYQKEAGILVNLLAEDPFSA